MNREVIVTMPVRIEYKIEKEKLMELILEHLSKKEYRIKKYNVKGISFCEDFYNKIDNDGKFFYVITGVGDNMKFKTIEND